MWKRLHETVAATRQPALSVGLLAMIVATIPGLRGMDWPWVDIVLTLVLMFFIFDWMLFVHAALTDAHPTGHLLTFTHLAHALGVVPVVVAFLAGVESNTAWLLCSLWLLKLPMATSGFSLLFRVAAIEAKPLASVAIIFLCVLFFSSVVMHLVEGNVQPQGFGTLAHALYWAVTTLTTTGYGDVVPITPIGRFTAGLVMICGLAVFGLWTGILATGFAAENRRQEFVRTWELVAKVPFFRTLTPAAIIEIARMLRRWDVPERSVVVRKGRQGDSMYFIASGQVEVLTDSQPIILNPGSFFGEMALLGGGIRTATVSTTIPTTLLVLDAADFQLLAAQHPELARVVEEEAERRRLNRKPEAPQPVPAGEIGDEAASG
jgi:voltage-gated potassium channel